MATRPFQFTGMEERNTPKSELLLMLQSGSLIFHLESVTMGVIRHSDVEGIQRAPGALSRPMVTEAAGSSILFTGVSAFEPGAGIKLHYHDCDESITIIEGEAVCEIAGEYFDLRPYDVVFVPQGQHHRFLNRGPGVMKFVWAYPQPVVDRVYVE